MTVLITPTEDLAKQDEEEPEEKESSMRRMINWFKKQEVPYGQYGFKSILMKCVHFRNARYRDLLMEISMFSEGHNVSQFVDSLDDIDVLFDNMSPVVVEFF